MALVKFNGNLDNPNVLTRCRYFLYKIALHKMFQHFINVIIIVNTICLSLDSYPSDSSLQAKLDKLNIAFFCIFTSEMLIKLIGLGIKNYVKEKFNLFDGFIVMMSIIDVIVNYSLSSDGNAGKSAVSAFRAFRLLRVFKLAKSWEKF